MEVTKSHCNNCLGIRNHEVLHREERSWSEEIDSNYDIYGNDKYETLRCLGCDHISIRHQSEFSEDTDEDGNSNVRSNYYPPAITRAKPKWMFDLKLALGFDKNYIAAILEEIYAATHSDLRSLAAMGVRALIENIMISKIGDNNSFQKNLSKFHAEGFISKIQHASLSPLIEAGHAAMHRGYTPSSVELSSLIDIIESLIEAVYINEFRAKSLDKNIPTRGEKNFSDT